MVLGSQSLHPCGSNPPKGTQKSKTRENLFKKTMAGLTRRDENSAEDAQAGGPVHGWDARRVHCPPFPGIGSFTDEPRRPSPGRFAFMFSRFWLYNYWWVCACIPLVIFRLKVCRPTVHGTITSKQRLVFFFSWHYRSWQSMFCGREIEVRVVGSVLVLLQIHSLVDQER